MKTVVTAYRAPSSASRIGIDCLPRLISEAGENVSRRFVEFFVATIRYKNTRLTYVRVVCNFLEWCEARGFTLESIEPIVVATYIEQHRGSPPTVTQYLAAVRMLFDWLVTGQIVPVNPAWSVRGPKHVAKRGKTPVLSAAEARTLLDRIDVCSISDLRDRVQVGLMIYSFARVSAAVGMNLEDYFPQGKRWWLRLHEKGGKRHDVPANHNAEAYLDAYLEAARVAGEKDTPLFRTVDRTGDKITLDEVERIQI